MEENKIKLRKQLKVYLKQKGNGLVKNWKQFAKAEGLKWDTFVQASLWCN